MLVNLGGDAGLVGLTVLTQGGLNVVRNIFQDHGISDQPIRGRMAGA